jgi:membrane carboxypeptidase/penicillin-binding protein
MKRPTGRRSINQELSYKVLWARGTARSMADLSPYIGVRRNDDNENDTWFVGFTNDVTIVWVGYDNGGKRRTLGSGQTGSRVVS